MIGSISDFRIYAIPTLMSAALLSGTIRDACTLFCCLIFQDKMRKKWKKIIILDVLKSSAFNNSTWQIYYINIIIIIITVIIIAFQIMTLREKLPVTELFWSIFLLIWTENRKIRTRNNSVSGHVSRSVTIGLSLFIFTGVGRVISVWFVSDFFNQWLFCEFASWMNSLGAWRSFIVSSNLGCKTDILLAYSIQQMHWQNPIKYLLCIIHPFSYKLVWHMPLIPLICKFRYFRSSPSIAFSWYF